MLDLSRVGILAFGSVVEEPGAELQTVVTRRIGVQTPFPVDFARSSHTRDGAPTLVPVGMGGAHIPALILVLDEPVTVADARAILYRRETRRPNDARTVTPVDWIAELPGFGGMSVCIYAALEANIPPPLTAEKLADLAVRSALGPAGASRRDGISYLQQQKRRGIETPLMRQYESVVLARTNAQDLDEAWRRVRSGSVLA
jgi:hypothetical protein